MSDVFISYKAEDRRRVQPLVQALQADGLSVWWDEHIGAGDAWRETIERQLDTARCVLVVWSKRSVAPEGRFVRDEAARSQRRGVYVPVLIDAIDPPLGFGESQATSLKGWRGDRSDPRYEAVLGAVRRITGTRRRSRGAQQEPSQPAFSRRAVVAGGAVATVAIAGGGAWMLLKPESAGESNSIAVLPFANLSGDPSQAYFSDGIAEELRSALSRLASLKVVGRTSSEAVRNEDAETAATKLGVSNILTGSVRQSPAVVRVSAQLIDGRTGIERWAQSYDRAPGDAIRIQTDIAESVARALSIALGGAAGSTLEVGGTQNPTAHNLVLQAQEAIDEDTKQGTDRALQLVDEALRLDPNYADAHARKSMYLLRRGNSFASGIEELARYRDQAVPAAKTALELAPNLARAHLAMGLVHQSNFNIAAAWAEHRRALQLAPGDAALLRRYSYFVSRLGNQSESLRLADKVVELDPLNPESYENRVGALFDARRYAEALQLAEETKRKSPEMFDDPSLLAHCLLMLGRLREAQQQYALLNTVSWERLTGEALVLAQSGDRSGVAGKLQQMHQLFGDAASYQYAEIYAQVGDRPRALAALERAWAVRDAGLINIRVDPLLDPIRDEARLQSIVRKMNFPV